MSFTGADAYTLRNTRAIDVALHCISMRAKNLRVVIRSGNTERAYWHTRELVRLVHNLPPSVIATEVDKIQAAMSAARSRFGCEQK